MPHAIWTGSLSFGLVNVPVRLTAATTDHDVHFNQLHDEDGVRVHTVRYCPEDEQIVPYEHIIRGYEVSKGEYIMLTDEELQAIDPEKTRTIDIQEFVSADDVDPLYFDRAYYLVPDGEAAGITRAYRLLVDTMSGSDRLALGRFVLHTKEYLVAIRAHGDALLLHTMHFQDELRPASELGELPTDRKVGKADVKKIVDEIERRADGFHPEKYEDDYQERLKALIEKKVENEKDIAEQPSELAGEPDEVPDLMAALERSLAGSRGDGAGAASAKTKKRNGGEPVSGSSREELYSRATELGIKGRSKMTKEELAEAIGRRG
jgi:DNA end-binding protein Ku